MAYTKTTWNNLSNPPINADNLNKIEQGIYDNSLGIDKINPSGTATTTAEIEEGQINDVIGFKSMKLKGQTSQYTTTGSQLFDISNTSIDTQYIYNNGFKLTKSTNRTREITLRTPIPAGNYYISADVINSTLSNNNQMYVTFKGANNTNVLENVRFLNNGAVTINAEVISLYFFVANSEADTATITLDNIMLNSGSTRKSFEKYTGEKASPNPDFPQDVNNVSGDNVVRISNKNLYDKDDSSLIMNNVYINATGFVLTSSNNMKTICMPCRANTTYTVSKTLSSRFIIGTASSNTIGTSMTAGRTNPSGTQVSVTSGANDKYLFVFYYNSSADTKTEQEIRNSIQVEIGSTATTFIAHQGNNFSIDLPVENLLNLTDGTYTNNGIEAVVRDGEITLNGTAGANNSYINIPYSQTIEPKIEYTLSLNNDFTTSNTSDGLRLSTNDDTRGSFTALNRTKTFTFQNALASNQLTLRLMAGSTVKNGKMKPQLEKGSIAHAFTPYNENPIELCEIGTYADYILRRNAKWFVHKEYEKLALKDLNWFLADNTGISNTNTHRWACNHPCARITNNNMQVTMSNILPKGSANLTWGRDELFIGQSVSQLIIRMPVEYTTLEQIQAVLQSKNAVGYALLTAPIEEEITYTPLIRQLDELYNSGLYDVTNISQDNSSEAFILDMEACKNNINGIIEYIRR